MMDQATKIFLRILDEIDRLERRRKREAQELTIWKARQSMLREAYLAKEQEQSVPWEE